MIRRVESVAAVFVGAPPAGSLGTALADLVSFAPSGFELLVQAEASGPSVYVSAEGPDALVTEHHLRGMCVALGVATRGDSIALRVPAPDEWTPLAPPDEEASGSFADAVEVIAEASRRDGEARWLRVRVEAADGDEAAFMKRRVLQDALLSRATGGLAAELDGGVSAPVLVGRVAIVARTMFPPASLVGARLGGFRPADVPSSVIVGTAAHLCDRFPWPTTNAWAVLGVHPLPRLGRPACGGDGLSLGRTPAPGARAIGLDVESMERHVALVGSTGAGKTTLLHGLVRGAIDRGDRAVVVVDPHGDLCDDLLARAAPREAERFVYVDFGDPDHAPGLNVLAARDDVERELALGTLDQFFLGIYGPEIWGPRIADAFRNLGKLASLMGLALVDVLGALEALRDDDEVGRLQALAEETGDPSLPLFLAQVRARPSGDGSVRELVPYFRAKLSPFCDPMLLRTVIGQTESTIDLAALVARRGVLLVNLAKGRISGRGASLLGSLVLTELAKTALSQADVPAANRNKMLIVADEFQNLVTEASADILAESRKYGASLVVGFQNLGQLDGDRMGRVRRHSLRGTLLGNCATTIAFRCGAEDAEVLARQLGGAVAEADLVGLPDFRAVCRVAGGAPFLLETARPAAPLAGSAGARIRAASLRFTLPRARVDAEIRARASQSFGRPTTLTALRALSRMKRSAP